VTAEHFPPPERSQRVASADAVRFILSLGRALHTYGYSADRLEEVLASVSHRLGVIGQFFSTPTSIFAAFGPQDEQQTFLMRVRPGDQDLGKLGALDEVTVLVSAGKLTPAQGARRVAEIVAAPPLYGDAATTLAYGVSSGAVSRFLGGGVEEILVATTIGIVLGLLAIVARRWLGLGRVFEAVASLVGSAIATAAGWYFGPLSVFTATLAGLIVLVPGLTLTTAMTELATRHLSSGIARLSAAVAIFLEIGFGVALGNQLMTAIVGQVPSARAETLPPWTLYAALVLVPLAFTVLLRAMPRDTGWIVLSGVVAFVGSRIGTHVLGAELGLFIGALAVGIGSNVYARLLDRPVAITQVPGVLLLVPGSIGYRSLAALLDREVVSGVETAFQMVMTAVSLVAGLLIANIVSPQRKSV
jgi:uncharacterized membrane protein YjjP (DUF1212 family)